MEPFTERHCERCDTKKPFVDFYQKQGRVEGEVRWEKICKNCKRLDRKKRYQQSKSSLDSTNTFLEPNRLIEPITIPEKEPDGLIEPEKTVLARSIAATDFSMWERICGRKITEEEKIEIVTRLGGYFKLLISENNKVKLEYGPNYKNK